MAKVSKDNLFIEILCCHVCVNSIMSNSGGLLGDIKYNKIKVCDSTVKLFGYICSDSCIFFGAVHERIKTRNLKYYH